MAGTCTRKLCIKSVRATHLILGWGVYQLVVTKHVGRDDNDRHDSVGCLSAIHVDEEHDQSDDEELHVVGQVPRPRHAGVVKLGRVKVVDK